MSPGSEPGRDDSGLPPVDVEIPDDARELDRDVHAYRRELKALRRHDRRSRWHRWLGRDGVMLPLLACCLILALITGTLLTVFTATSEQGLTGPPGSAANSVPATGRLVPYMVSAQLPPRAVIAVHGQRPVLVSQLRQAMLVLVPPGCACGSTLAWLADAAESAGANAYVVYNQQTKAEVQRLHSELTVDQRRELQLADDTSGLLTSPASYPASILPTRLTAVLVSREGIVRYASELSPTEAKSELVTAIIY